MDWEQDVPEGAELGGHGADRAFTLIHGPPTEHDNTGSKNKSGGSDLGAAEPCLALLQSLIDVCNNLLWAAGKSQQRCLLVKGSHYSSIK